MRNLIYCLILLFSSSAHSAPAGSPQLFGSKALKYPIVLVHGATTKGSELKIGIFDFGEYFRNITFFYQPTGTPIHVAHLSTDGSIGERAAVLKNFLETEMRGKMVNIVAHSLGGLDARYAVSMLNCKQIASITTIGTPHRGSPLADWAVRQVKNNYPWYWLFRFFGYDMKQRRFLNEITTEFMANIFNPRVVDSKDVKYFSVVTSAKFANFSMSYWLYFPSKWLEAEKHPLAANGHDGLVPYDSQAWGTVISTQSLDHLGQINHHELRGSSYQATSLVVYTAIYDNLLMNGL